MKNCRTHNTHNKSNSPWRDAILYDIGRAKVFLFFVITITATKPLWFPEVRYCVCCVCTWKIYYPQRSLAVEIYVTVTKYLIDDKTNIALCKSKRKTVNVKLKLIPNTIMIEYYNCSKEYGISSEKECRYGINNCLRIRLIGRKTFAFFFYPVLM